jgi:hypothetical protein
MEIDMSEFAQMKPVAIRRYIAEHYLENGEGVAISAVAKHFQTSPAFVRRCCDEAVMHFDYITVDGWSGSHYARRSRGVETVEPSKRMLVKLLREARASQNT